MILKPYQKLQRYWEDSASGIETGAFSEVEVGKLENRYGVRLPEDFREYLLHACPRDEDNMDANGTCWWPLARIKNIPDEDENYSGDGEVARSAAACIFFADFLIWCEAWAVDCSDGENRGRVAVISGQDRFVADNFSEFVDFYLADDKRIY